MRLRDPVLSSLKTVVLGYARISNKKRALLCRLNFWSEKNFSLACCRRLSMFDRSHGRLPRTPAGRDVGEGYGFKADLQSEVAGNFDGCLRPHRHVLGRHSRSYNY